MFGTSKRIVCSFLFCFFGMDHGPVDQALVPCDAMATSPGASHDRPRGREKYPVKLFVGQNWLVQKPWLEMFLANGEKLEFLLVLS